MKKTILLFNIILYYSISMGQSYYHTYIYKDCSKQAHKYKFDKMIMYAARKGSIPTTPHSPNYVRTNNYYKYIMLDRYLICNIHYFFFEEGKTMPDYKDETSLPLDQEHIRIVIDFFRRERVVHSVYISDGVVFLDGGYKRQSSLKLNKEGYCKMGKIITFLPVISPSGRDCD